jgi:hypothetical protein
VNALHLLFGQKKVFISENLYPNLAVWTGLEPATPCVTGMYSNQLNYQTSALLRLQIYNGFLFVQHFFLIFIETLKTLTQNFVFQQDRWLVFFRNYLQQLREHSEYCFEHNLTLCF